MAPQKREGSKRKPFLRILDIIVAIIVVLYIVPAVKHTFFPDQMTRLAKMLRRTTMNGYDLAVDHRDEFQIILTTYDGGRSIATEIYRDEIRELEPSGGNRVFFTYSLNRDSKEIFYLTRTKIEADADLKQVRRLEVTVCGRLKDQHAGVTRFDGYEPVYECDVPLQQAVCQAAESTAR
jgi:hypothetical protein